MLANQLKRKLLAGLGVCLLASAPALHATLPQMYPTFSTPSTITTVNLYGTSATSDDLMAEVTLQGAYNQLKGTNRLYVTFYPQDVWWLQQSTPSGVTVQNLSFNISDPDGALKAMLAAYGPQGSNSVSKYIVCDPINNQESCNMATTMAGINDAMVIYPDNLSLMSTYGMTQLADLRTYLWIGSDSFLVGNTSINWIGTPGGGSGGGTTGWSTNSCSGNTLGTSTYLSVANAIKWTSPANVGTICGIVNSPASFPEGDTYVFSAQVAGSGTVMLDVWTGNQDVGSTTVTLNSTGWQTIQLTVPMPTNTAATPPKIEVRADTTNNAITCYMINAAIVRGAVAVDEYQYKNLISSTNSLAPAILTTNDFDDRDYYVAAKMFVFYIDSSGADSSALFDNIVAHWGDMTPVVGYTESEAADVTYLSEHGHFHNVSNEHKNGSVWASLPGPASLTQPAPAGIKSQNGYIYLAFYMSDGDNISFMQNNNQAKWTEDQWLGAVPVGWTAGPASITYSPEMLSFYYKFLPQSYEQYAGPSGVGYVMAMTGSDLTTFSNLTNEFMTALGMSTAETMETDQNDPNEVKDFATQLNLPHVMSSFASFPYTQLSNSAQTVIDDGRIIATQPTPDDTVSKIQSWVGSNCVSTAPCFAEVQLLNADLNTDNVAYIAEQLEINKSSGQEYVFLTPSELALTEANYHNGGPLTATSNAQATPGATLNKEFPTNYVQNADGQQKVKITGLFSLLNPPNNASLMYQNYQGYTQFGGGRVQQMQTYGSTSADVVAQASLQSIPIAGWYYHFKMLVAGTGQAQIGIYNGTTWTYSSTVTLTSNWQELDVITNAPSSGGLYQVIIPPSSSSVTLYFTDASWTPKDWAMIGTVSGATEDLNPSTYNYAPALSFTLGPTNGHTQEIFQQLTKLKTSTSYTWSVDVAGSGDAYLQAQDSSTLCATSTVTLTTGYQTLSCTGSTTSSGTPEIFVITPANSSAQSIYVRNASVVPTSSLGTVDFNTGVETGQTQLTWTNTVDTTAPGGRELNVTNAVLQLTTNQMSRGGSNAIQYGGTATNGAHVYAYMKAFSDSATLTSTSRLSYWVFPQTPNGAEPGASSTTGLNSTCVAIDIVFTDNTELRDSGVTDQYGNQLHPAHQCGHLQPDRWNYVTADLSKLAGKTINRIDIGYDEPNAPSGNYGGYVDDINIHH